MVESSCFLSFDLTPKRLRALILDEQLDVLVGELVTFDVDLPGYGTKGGVHVGGEGATAPTHMYIRALDEILSRLAQVFDLSRIRVISGSAPQHQTAWWSLAASTLLLRLNPQKRLTEQLPPEQTWTLLEPPIGGGGGAEAGALEWCAGGSAGLCSITGGRAFGRGAATQVIKVVQAKRHLFEATERIGLASGLFASVFLGTLAPMGEAEAASVGLWSVSDRRWDPHLLSIAMDPTGSSQDAGIDAAKLSRKLGSVSLDGAAPLGPIASYFVRRYGFDASCTVGPFHGHHSAAFLAYRLGERDALVSLGKGEADLVVTPVKAWVPDPARNIVPDPTLAKGEGLSYFGVLEYKDAGLARAFVRDVYCSGSWHVFDTLVTLIAEGGKIGLDDKLFSFFWPHGEMGVWQGISRFEFGQRTDEFNDRRANPRTLLESQFLTIRMQLARLAQGALLTTDPSAPPPPTYDLGFSPFDRSVLPLRLIVAGGASENRVLIDLLSSVIGCPVYQLTSLSASTHASAGYRGPEKALSPCGLGAGYKAVWMWLRSKGSGVEYGEFLDERFKQRTQRHRANTLDNRRPSIPLITTSIASFEAPEASLDEEGAAAGYGGRRMSFSTVKLSAAQTMNLNGLGGPGSPTTPTGSVLVVPIHTHPDDAEKGLVQVAEPDEDLFERYGGLVEEFARLDNFVSRGVI